jgi:LCP family protein required for cell wall assembly
MVVRADPETEAVSMLSFPRDLLVEIKCPGPRPDYVGRINSAYSECRGPIGTLRTVRALTGLPINYLITVDFGGFRQIVDELGGVWIDVDRRYFNDNAGRITGVNTYATIDLQPGYQRLNGSDTLDFVRYRHTDDDFHRIARQQLFVKSFKAQVSSAFSPLKLPSLIDAVTSNVEIARGGGKEVDFGIIKSYALLLYSLPSGHFFQPRIEGLEQDASFNLIPTEAGLDQAITEFTAPDVEAPERAAAVVLGLKLEASGPRPRDVTVSVLNGNGVAGSAANAGVELARRGYTIVAGEQGNAPSWDYLRTKVYYDPEQAQSRAAAAKVRILFGAADVEPLPADIEPLSSGGMLTVVVGQTFQGTIAAAPIDRTPKKEPPAVQVNPEATRPLLREVQRRVPFRLMLPRLIERSSTIDREAPIRVYPIAKGHRAVRLTFRYGDQNAYWGIEQTDWQDAPILQSPNLTRVIKKRSYEFHYSGSRLHMVVLRANGATYWVVNTLLDTLSNDTMLAIAKGLRPLGK